ncbi:MAG: hypothetical protein ACFB0A_08800 [Croceivirga sp.]
MKKYSKKATIIGVILLIIMSIFHGSGTRYVTEIIEQSNTEDFAKNIFPVLFVHPSIHLLGLAVLGVLTLFMKHETRKIKFFIAILVGIDAILAFYLKALVPGIALLLSASLFLIDTKTIDSSKPSTSDSIL